MERKVNLVFGGGGLKAVAFCGVLEEFERQGIEIASFAGVSAGNMVAIALAAGYSINELKKLVYESDFSKFTGNITKAALRRKKSGSSLLAESITIVEEHCGFENIRKYFGLEDGSATKEWLINVLRQKNIQTDIKFKDLNCDFRVFAYDITEDCGRVFSKKETPEESVIEAVLASMALVPIFRPVKWRDSDGFVHILIDGGFADVCPMEIFDEDSENKNITIGLLATESNKPKNRAAITTSFEFLSKIIGKTMKNQESRHMSEEQWDRVMTIETDIDILDFIRYGNDEEKKKDLWLRGKSTAENFLKERNKWLFLPWPLKQFARAARKIKPQKK